MPKVLTKQQIDRYQEQGFISPIDVMSEADAGICRQKLEDAERDYPQEISAQNRNNTHLCFSFLDELVHHPIILDAVADLIGPNISLWGTVLFIKEARSAGFVSWHQDATYMGIQPHNFVTPWLALTPSNRNNGCMSMIPGSHREHIRSHRDTFDEDNILTRGQAVSEVDASTAIDLILRPGQMSLHHAEIIHGSQPNLSDDRRIGLAMQAYMPPQARQLVGKNYWLDIRGENHRQDGISLHRPEQDMDPRGLAERRLANENWADILYRGAAKKRDY